MLKIAMENASHYFSLNRIRVSDLYINILDVKSTYCTSARPLLVALLYFDPIRSLWRRRVSGHDYS